MALQPDLQGREGHMNLKTWFCMTPGYTGTIHYTVYKIEDGVAKNVYGTGYRLATTFFVVLSNFKLFQLKVKYHRDSVRKKIEQGQNN